jgi:hypothetical protein
MPLCVIFNPGLFGFACFIGRDWSVCEPVKLPNKKQANPIFCYVNSETMSYHLLYHIVKFCIKN